MIIKIVFLRSLYISEIMSSIEDLFGSEELDVESLSQSQYSSSHSEYIPSSASQALEEVFLQFFTVCYSLLQLTVLQFIDSYFVKNHMHDICVIGH